MVFILFGTKGVSANDKLRTAVSDHGGKGRDLIPAKSHDLLLQGISFLRLFFVYILHHILYAALQQPTELVDGVCRYIVAVLHGVEIRQRKAQLPKPV